MKQPHEMTNREIAAECMFDPWNKLGGPTSLEKIVAALDAKDAALIEAHAEIGKLREAAEVFVLSGSIVECWEPDERDPLDKGIVTVTVTHVAFEKLRHALIAAKEQPNA